MNQISLNIKFRFDQVKKHRPLTKESGKVLNAVTTAGKRGSRRLSSTTAGELQKAT